MKERCCDDPNINGRWTYCGSELVKGYCYCKTCGGNWVYDAKQKKLVKTDG